MARINTDLYKSSILLISVTVVLFSDYTNSKPIQILQNKPGYIGVYIRHGNEPLININPALAEAFHEEIIQNGVIPLEDHEDSVIQKITSDNEKPEKSRNPSNGKNFFIPLPRPYVVHRSS
ncbi:uncharacterized protein LOC123258484 [Cotesia glomerata]|uniref:Uncharacterized protein n=1 Tax=Cotesia glomerata TaxID=32391 RepID=A0AAV7J803_COTGL|nr:uncharacterized protein LOC123258484 [Cotesia glomerata]KAH0567636.1 hypothetical protein KQX54_011156 [Cotesia glomerata]